MLLQEASSAWLAPLPFATPLCGARVLPAPWHGQTGISLIFAVAGHDHVLDLRQGRWFRDVYSGLYNAAGDEKHTSNGSSEKLLEIRNEECR